MPQIIGKADKSALSCQPGEEMGFSFKMDCASAKPGKYYLRYLACPSRIRECQYGFVTRKSEAIVWTAKGKKLLSNN